MKFSVIYQWPESRGYLVHRLLPAAHCLAAEPGETYKQVLERLPAECESFWFHTACSKTACFPAGRSTLLASLAERGVQVVNAQVTDISKRNIQQINREHGFVDVIAAEAGDPDELIIVKSNYNWVGGGERLLSAAEQAAIGLDPLEAVPEGFAYQVKPRSEVEPAYWTNPAYVCERFIQNDVGIWYRAWLNRPQLALIQLQNPAPIKKTQPSKRLHANLLRTDDSTTSSKIASLVIQFINAFQLDFGAVDVVTDLKGNAAVIDVNTTPWGAASLGVDQYLSANLSQL